MVEQDLFAHCTLVLSCHSKSVSSEQVLFVSEACHVADEMRVQFAKVGRDLEGGEDVVGPTDVDNEGKSTRWFCYGHGSYDKQGDPTSVIVRGGGAGSDRHRAAEALYNFFLYLPYTRGSSRILFS